VEAVLDIAHRVFENHPRARSSPPQPSTHTCRYVNPAARVPCTVVGARREHQNRECENDRLKYPEAFHGNFSTSLHARAVCGAWPLSVPGAHRLGVGIGVDRPCTRPPRVASTQGALLMIDSSWRHRAPSNCRECGVTSEWVTQPVCGDCPHGSILQPGRDRRQRTQLSLCGNRSNDRRCSQTVRAVSTGCGSRISATPGGPQAFVAISREYPSNVSGRVEAEVWGRLTSRVRTALPAGPCGWWMQNGRLR
jgi:hypothetical protein